MAVNDDTLDELVALYRQSANETAPRRLDARVLRAVESRASARRLRHVWPWLGLAMAASFAMWLSVYRAAPTHMPAAGDATSLYLLHMDITPPDAHGSHAGRDPGFQPATAGNDTFEEFP